MLDVRGLTKVYGPGGGIRDASFSLPAGSVFTLLGPSGCGKTTTLRCIAGLETPDAGSVRIGGRVVFDGEARVSLPMNERDIGMVFQSYAIWPHMTVAENVAFPLEVAKGVPRKEIAARVARALETVDLADFGARPATRLSGGQQQRVALARAIVREPALLLLDEPLSNLDAALRAEMRRELAALQRRLGVTTVYVTHDQEEALSISDLIAVVSAGRIVQLGTPRDVWFRPATPFVARFVGATNLLRGVAGTAAAAEAVAGVRLEDGRTIPCTFSAGSDAGGAVAVSIRPEALRLAEAGGGGPDAAGETGAADGSWAGCGPPNLFEGVVVARTFLGSAIRYEVAVGAARLQVVSAAEVAPGAAVVLAARVEDTVAVPGEA